jgi:predicted ATPase/DNA-binding SARP family transcriptional activator
VPDTPRLRYRILGPLAVEDARRPVTIAGRKQRAVLALLLLRANTIVSRDQLVDALWGDEPPDTARNTVQVFVADLRRALRAVDLDPIVTRAPGYSISVEPGELDLDVFERLAAEGRAALADGDAPAASAKLHAALELWRGDALAEFEHEPFAVAEIRRLEELWLAAVEDRLDADLGTVRGGELVGELTALTAAHPLRERLHRHLMVALFRAGRQADALDAYWTARRTLVDELGIQPGAELQRLQQAILKQDVSLEPVLAPPEAERPRIEVPVPLTRLLGRESELAAASQILLDDETRLLTITGPGGIGKTRLSLELARSASASFADGVVFVPLEHARDAATAAAALCERLALTASPDPVAALHEHLRDRRLLLVLDNFEQLVSAAPLLASLLSAAGRLKLLVTSRTTLHVAGEREFALSSLTVPDVSVPRVPEVLVRIPSVALFVQRCQAVKRDFSLTPENAAAVAEICTTLEGIPLSLELAAGRIRVLDPEAMLERLGRRLELLTDTRRDVPARHETVRATIAWSYDLLEPSEQRLFAELGVFAGGFTLDAAEAVCRGDSVLDGLQALLDNSLLRETGAGPRFAMLETIREHALERLEATGHAGETRDAHLSYCADFAESADAQLTGPATSVWLQRLSDEHDNLRSALARAEASADAAAALRLAVALRRFWRIKGHLAEGRRALEHALAAGSEAPLELQARAQNSLGILAGEQGDLDVARGAFERSLGLARSLEERDLTISALINLGNLRFFERDLERAGTLYGEALELGRLAGDPHRSGIALENLGAVALARGDLDDALLRFEECLAAVTESANEERIATVGRGLAHVLIERGERSRAAELLATSLATSRRLGEPAAIADSLDGVAALSAETDEEAVVSLLAAADEIRASIGARALPDQRGWRESVLAAAGGRLDPESRAEAAERGRAMSIEEAADYAAERVARVAATAAP